MRTALEHMEAIAIRWLVGDYPSVEYLYKLDAKPCSP